MNAQPLDRFRLPSGHLVGVYSPGQLGLPIYADHRQVMIEDTGDRASNRRAAKAAVAHQKR